MIVLVLMAFLGLVMVVAGWRMGATTTALRKLPVHGVAEATGSGAEATAPRLCSVRGRVYPPNQSEPEPAPLSGKPCVWWRLRVHPRRPLSRPSSIHLPVAQESHAPFHLEEADTRIRVDPDPAMSCPGVPRAWARERQTRTFHDRRTPITDRIRQRFPTVREHMVELDPRRVDFTEWRIPDGQEVTVTGWLTRDPATGEPVMSARRAPGEGPVLNVSPDPDGAVASLRRRRLVLLVVGAALLVGAVVVLVGGFSGMVDRIG